MNRVQSTLDMSYILSV